MHADLARDPWHFGHTSAAVPVFGRGTNWHFVHHMDDCDGFKANGQCNRFTFTMPKSTGGKAKTAGRTTEQAPAANVDDLPSGSYYRKVIFDKAQVSKLWSDLALNQGRVSDAVKLSWSDQILEINPSKFAEAQVSVHMYKH